MQDVRAAVELAAQGIAVYNRSLHFRCFSSYVRAVLRWFPVHPLLRCFGHLFVPAIQRRAEFLERFD